jgi:hypothetical protein
VIGALPVLAGAVKDTEAVPSPGVAETPEGAPGLPAKVRSQWTKESSPCGWITRAHSSHDVVASQVMSGASSRALVAVPVLTRKLPATCVTAALSAKYWRNSSPVLGTALVGWSR